MKNNNKFNKEELEQMIFVDKLTYREIGRKYNVSDAYIKKVCKKLEIKLEIRSHFPPNWEPHNKGKTKKKEKCCLNCGKCLIRKQKKFCSFNCQNQYYRENKTIPSILSGECRNVSSLKKYLFETRGENCEKCGQGTIWNGEKLTLQLDHIDGNSDNCKLENLRILCPNCHTQTDTFSARNHTNSKRNTYFRQYYKNRAMV